MMSPATIRRLADEAADQSRARGKETPWVPFDNSYVNRANIRHIPNIGSRSVRGWNMVEHKLVDKTGYDLNDAGGPALSVNSLIGWIREQRLVEPKGYEFGYAIIEEGEFQVVVGQFRHSIKIKEKV